MCGIVGMAGRPTSVDHDKMFKDMLHMDVVRGEDSTGVLAVKHNGERVLVKAAVLPSDLLHFKKAKKLFAGHNTLILGHNRAATVGSIDNQSAHPFQHGDITGVHNGTLNGWQRDLDDSVDFDVDSDCLIHNLSVNNPKDVIEEIAGAWALVWYNSRNHTLSMVRNDKRPLWLAHDNKGLGNMYWASEKWMLDVASSRNSIEIQEPYQLPLDTIFTWELPDKTGKGLEGKPHAQKVKPRAVTVQVYQGRNHGGHNGYNGGYSNRGNVAALPGRSSSNSNGNSSSGQPTKPMTPPEDIDLLERRDKHLARRAIAEYYESLMGTDVMIVPMKFEEYPGAVNGKDGSRKGYLMCYLADDSTYDVRIHCSEADATVLLEHNLLSGRVSGNSCPWISGGTNVLHLGHLTVAYNTVDVVIEEAGDDTPTDDEEFEGPSGKMIDREEFLKLAKNGCGCCSGTVSPGDKCEWFNNEPICEDCVDNDALKTVMEA